VLGINDSKLNCVHFEGIYSELYQASLVFGAGQPIAIKADLQSCVLENCRQFFDRPSFVGSARLYSGVAINCRFVTPYITIQGTSPVFTDKFIRAEAGSFGNSFDRFLIKSSVPSTAITNQVDPSQHTQFVTTTEKSLNQFVTQRESNRLGFSVPYGQSWAAAPLFPFLTTISAGNLNTNSRVRIRVTVRTSAIGAGAQVNLAGIIGGQTASTPAVTLTPAAPSATFELLLTFGGSVDKTYSSSAAFYSVGTAALTGSADQISNNSGLPYPAVNLLTSDLAVSLSIFSLSDGSVSFINGEIEVTSGIYI
jgi:hypothetical protein